MTARQQLQNFLTEKRNSCHEILLLALCMFEYYRLQNHCVKMLFVSDIQCVPGSVK